jgi:hypothetical protein
MLRNPGIRRRCALAQCAHEPGAAGRPRTMNANKTTTLGVIAALATALACSPKTSEPCFEQSYAMIGASCLSCMTSACSQEMSDAANGCADYTSCLCPSGSLSAAAVGSSSACQTQLMEPSCTNVATLLNACEIESCHSPCVGKVSDAAGNGENDAAYKTVVFSCTYTASPAECIQHDTLAATLVPSSQMSCTAAGGTAGGGCPAAGLVGCCRSVESGSVSSQCYYDATSAAAAQMSCTSAEQSWTTSP